MACLLFSPETAPGPEEWRLALPSLPGTPRLLSDSKLVSVICSGLCVLLCAVRGCAVRREQIGARSALWHRIAEADLTTLLEMA